MANPLRVGALTLLLMVVSVTSTQVAAQTDGNSFQAGGFRTGEIHRPRMALDRYAFATLGVSTLQSIPSEQGRDSQRLYRFGFNVQMPQDRGSVQYGTEVGFNLDYKSSYDMYVRLSGEGSTFRVRSDLWLADASLGGFLSARPSQNLRLYLSGGPALYWGRRGGGRASGSEFDSSTGVTIRHDRRSGQNAWHLGTYMQTGVEIIVSPRTTFGFNVRQSNVTLNFGSRGEPNHSAIRMRRPQYAFTLGYHF